MRYSTTSPYWGSLLGTPDADSSVTFTSAGSPTTSLRVVFAERLSTLRNYRFGIYKKGNPAVKLQLFPLPSSSNTAVVKPQWDFGFYLEVLEPGAPPSSSATWTWYTEARFNSQDATDRHFAFFDVSKDAGLSSGFAYVIGIDDVPFSHAWSDRDYQDLVFFIAPVGVEITLLDAETGTSIPGVLLAFQPGSAGASVNVESPSRGTVYIPVNDNLSQQVEGMLQAGRRYRLVILPRKYYRRADSSVATYLTPAGGAGATDIGIEVAADAQTIYPRVVAGVGWGRVYWHLTGNRADDGIVPDNGAFRLSLYLIPIKLERLPEGENVLQYSMDRFFEGVRLYNQNPENEDERVPPHIAYATFMIETSGQAYWEFQDQYWTRVNNKAVTEYPHVHYSQLPNCTEEHTDSGFGPGQLTGLAALEMIEKNMSTWLAWSWDGEARDTAINGLSRLASPVTNTVKMLQKLSSAFLESGFGVDRSRLADWARGGKQSAIQLYDRYDNNRNGAAWLWLSNADGQHYVNPALIGSRLRPFPLDILRKWDEKYTDNDYDGDLLEGLGVPVDPPTYTAGANDVR